ncbi:MAG: trans-aconitate 2-methyltransferase [Psychroflexus sp.]
MSSSKYWNQVYKTKAQNEVGWYQDQPEQSLNFIEAAQLPKDAKIIDIGGGHSFLVDRLLELGYQNLSVLDISEIALQKTKERLSEQAQNVEWIVSEITEYRPSENFDLWHDRATFHFLIEDENIATYRKTVSKSVKKGGHFIIGTFSKSGPSRCSGLPVNQYDLEDLEALFAPEFQMEDGTNFNHITPSGGKQHYSFARFKKV